MVTDCSTTGCETVWRILRIPALRDTQTEIQTMPRQCRNDRSEEMFSCVGGERLANNRSEPHQVPHDETTSAGVTPGLPVS